MGAVDVGVGHDDDLVVTQIGGTIVRSRSRAERLHEVRKLLVLRELVAGGGRDVEDLAAQRQDRLRGAVARLLSRAACGIALDDK